FTEHGLAINPATSRLYVADLGANSVSGFKADLNSGLLTALPNSPYFTDGDRPMDLAISSDGSRVFVSNNNSSTISVFSANTDGSLSAVAGSPFNTDGLGPAGMVMNQLGTFLFVANGGFGGSKDVSVYRIDTGGGITPVPGSPFSTDSIGIPTAIGIIEIP